MDKNTLTGLLLIGALLLGFSWLNQPTPETSSPTGTEQAVVEPSGTAIPATSTVATPTATQDSATLASMPLYRQPRAVRTATLSNELLTVDFSTQGGTPTMAELSSYKDYQGRPVRLFGKDDIRLNLPLRTRHGEILNTSDLVWEVAAQSDTTLVMRLPIQEGSHMDLSYTLRPGDYRLGIRLSGVGLDQLLHDNATLQDLEWWQRIPQQEQSHRFEKQYSGIYYLTRSGDVEDITTGSEDSERVSDALRWIAVKDKYFSSALVLHTGAMEDTNIELTSEEESTGYIYTSKVTTTFPYSPRSGATADFTLFLGPNDYDLLRGYDEGLAEGEKLQLDQLVYLGLSLFRWINLYLIIPVVNFLRDFTSNWGLIILLLTIFIKALLYPFTHKSYMSQAKMRVLKPQVDQIAKKYEGKTDQDSMLRKQQETMGLYSSAGASPLSGCLPMLLQFPFLIALYMYFPTSILLRGQSFLWADDLSSFDPIISWSAHIPIVSGLLGNHISLFCLLMTIVNIAYMRYTTSFSGGSQDAMPGMKMMPYMMSIMFFFMFNQNASGLSYYYLVSTLITIAQFFAFRWLLDEEKLLAQLEENKKKPRKKSKFMQRLEEAQRQQRELQRQRERGK